MWVLSEFMSCIYYASKKIRINREEILFVCKVVSILWSLMLRITYQRSKEEDMFSFINFDEGGRKKRIFLKNILWMENIIYKLVVINKLKWIIKRIEEWSKMLFFFKYHRRSILFYFEIYSFIPLSEYSFVLRCTYRSEYQFTKFIMCTRWNFNHSRYSRSNRISIIRVNNRKALIKANKPWYCRDLNRMHER